MAMKHCPICGERYSDTYKTCPFCEEEEYWEEEPQESGRRPILREGVRGTSRGGGRSAYGIITPILIVLIALMALLLIYLLYGDKIAAKFQKDPDDNKPGMSDTKEPDPKPEPGTTPAKDPATTDPDIIGSGDGENPGDGSMPEGSGDGGSGTPSSGGMSYASAAALPSGLTLNKKDFSRSPAEGPYQLKVSGGTGTYTWISENPAIATVASDGTVTPVANGTTNILVTDGSKKATCIVRVNGASNTAPATTAPSPTPSGGTTSNGGGTTSNGGTTSSGGGTTSSGGLKAGSAKVINGGNGVRVRSGPGTSYDILATVPNGGSITVVRNAEGDWYEITFVASGGVTMTGYMKGEFLSNT